jgi:hypothetical protein
VVKNEKVELLLIGGYFVLGSRRGIITAGQGERGLFSYQLIKIPDFQVAFKLLSSRFQVAQWAMCKGNKNKGL